MSTKKNNLSRDSESNILRSVCDYLALKKYFFWRSNTTPVYDANQKFFRRMPVYAMKGVPDIIVIYKGSFIGIEVKRPGTYQSPEQKEFEMQCNRNGGSYFVVRSVDDIIKLDSILLKYANTSYTFDFSVSTQGRNTGPSGSVRGGASGNASGYG